MSTVAYNPLTDYIAAPNPGPVPTNSAGNATMGAVMGPTPQGQAYAASSLQGKPPLFGRHNTPLHVAMLGLLALAVLVLLHKGGFRFAFAGRLGRG